MVEKHLRNMRGRVTAGQGVMMMMMAVVKSKTHYGREGDGDEEQ
jgi:hypothetical protein